MRPLAYLATIIGIIGIFWTWRLLQWFVSANTIAACVFGQSCASVFSTSLSYFLGIPIHLFALSWFICMTIISILGIIRNTSAKYGTILGSLALPTVIYLDYLQLAVIRAICWDCVIAHVLGLAMFGIFTIMFIAERRVITK